MLKPGPHRRSASGAEKPKGLPPASGLFRHNSSQGRWQASRSGNPAGKRAIGHISNLRATQRKT
jgi:hypothetical protein